MENDKNLTDDKKLIDSIENHRRYYFTSQWIFPNDRYIVSAFMRENFNHGFHVQFFYEVTVITRGEGYHFIGDETIHAGVGDVFIVPPGVRHAFLPKDGGFDVFHFHFSPAFTKKFISVLRDYPGFFNLFELAEREDTVTAETSLKYRYIYLEKPELEYLHGVLLDMQNSEQSYKTYHILNTKALLVISLLCHYYSKIPVENELEEGRDDPFTRSVLYAIENCTSDITVSELARMAGLSETGYIKRFKSKMGTTPYKFIIKERLGIARRLLGRTKKTVAAIAEETGFYDVSHLVRAFVAEYGITPTEFRESKG